MVVLNVCPGIAGRLTPPSEHGAANSSILGGNNISLCGEHPMSGQPTVADYIVRRLAREGITDCFGVRRDGAGSGGDLVSGSWGSLSPFRARARRITKRPDPLVNTRAFAKPLVLAGFCKRPSVERLTSGLRFRVRFGELIVFRRNLSGRVNTPTSGATPPGSAKRGRPRQRRP